MNNILIVYEVGPIFNRPVI